MPEENETTDVGGAAEAAPAATPATTAPAALPSTTPSAPEVEPTVPTVPEADSTLTDDAGNVTYEELLADEPEEGEVEEESEETVQETTPPEDSVEAPPAEEVPAVEPTPATLAPEVPPPDVSAAAEPTMDELETQYLENRKQVEADVASNVYAMSEEQIQKLDEGDTTVIPQMMARVYMDAVTGAVAHMLTKLPGLVEQTLQSREQSSELENRFYTAWPVLKDEKYGTEVERFGQVYRQLNPNAAPDDFIRDVGAQLVVALKLPQGGGNGAAVPKVAAVQPAAKPYVPAPAGSGGSTAGRPTNPFELLAEEMAQEDLT